MRVQANPLSRSCKLTAFLSLLILSLIASWNAHAGANDLVVEETAGAVKIMLDNRWQSPAVGMILQLPATVSTGADGSIRLRQNATVISIAANTAIELIESPGGPLQRVVQSQGSAFYDIAPRESSRLRVETPYLVAVIKGTEFNVTVAAETSTVSLFEGRLQIEAPDTGDVVDLQAGQIARRHRDDRAITVVRMDDGEPVARHESASNDASVGGGKQAEPSDPTRDHVYAGIRAGGEDPDIGAEDCGGTGPEVDAIFRDVDEREFGGSFDGPPATVFDVHVDIGGDDLDLALAAELELGDAGAIAGLELDVGGGDLDVGLDASLDVADAGLDLPFEAGIDVGAGDIDLALDGTAGLGDTVAELEIDAGIDVDDVDLDLGLAASVDPVVGVDLDAGLDLDHGSLDVGGDAGLGGAALDAAIDAEYDLAGGDVGLGVDAGVDLGVADAGVNLDLGAILDPAGLDDIIDIDAGLGLLDDEESESDETAEDETIDLPVEPRDLLDLLGL